MREFVKGITYIKKHIFNIPVSNHCHCLDGCSHSHSISKNSLVKLYYQYYKHFDSLDEVLLDLDLQQLELKNDK